jgi:hypothetical protein
MWHQKKSSPRSSVFSPMLSSMKFSSVFYIYICYLIWCDFSEKCKAWLESFFCVCVFSVPTPFVESIIFAPLCCILSFVKNQLTKLSMVVHICSPSHSRTWRGLCETACLRPVWATQQEFIRLRRTDILTVMSLPIHENGMSLHFFSSLITCTQVWQFPAYHLLHNLVTFIPKYYILFGNNVKDFAFWFQIPLGSFLLCRRAIYSTIHKVYLTLYSAILL